jgi:hypothetical protein
MSERTLMAGRRARLGFAAILLALTLAASVAGGALARGGEDRPRVGGWPEDVNGDGVISDSGDERIPELISAVGDSGIEGYVRYADLEGPQPSSPEEAMRMSGVERVIPVYAEDGKTVMDQYTLSGDPPSATLDS